MTTDRLPIFEIKDRFLAACREAHRRVLLTAPTGSGKSTQIPQFLLDSGLLGDGKIVILQPRRLAARLLAARVAAERGTPLGGEVGYQIRLESRSSAATRIEFVTEGILLRRFLSDPALPGVSAILFDEFHERHAYGDVTLAQALLAQKNARPDLLLVVASATLDTPRLAAYLAPCATVASDGRRYPVDISYLPRPLDPTRTPPWQAAADAFADAVATGPLPPATLVFMPGAYEIARTVDALRDLPAARRCALLPLPGELPPDAQDAAVAPSDTPKIIVST
ncbi:MAG: helicase, partial [Kiritimatiellae bacterium]|nr:helicase [Kiritimatiellia bacterium]